MKTKLIVIAFCATLCACTSQKKEGNNESGKVVLAYVTANTQPIPNPKFVTHINYAFGHVNKTFNGVEISNEPRLRKIVELKKQNPQLKVLLSIGGWTSGGFSEMAATDSTRKSFAADCGRIVRDFNLDGIDMDWNIHQVQKQEYHRRPTMLTIFRYSCATYAKLLAAINCLRWQQLQAENSSISKPLTRI